MSDAKPHVSIELGASAKAELRAEVPASSMGRLVDALTDSIRPFTEARGLRADQIRLQREDVLIEVAKKARERLAIENREPVPIPNKLLVPLLEKASLEAPDDDEMISRWANLLSSASRVDSVEPRLVGILGELRGADADLLERIFFGKAGKREEIREGIRARIELLRPDYSAARMIFDRRVVEGALDTILNSDNEPLDHAHGYATLILNGPGLYLRDYALSNVRDHYDLMPREKRRDGDHLSADILASLGLLENERVEVSSLKWYLDIEYMQISPLGLRLLVACSPKTSDELDRLELLDNE